MGQISLTPTGSNDANNFAVENYPNIHLIGIGQTLAVCCGKWPAKAYENLSVHAQRPGSESGDRSLAHYYWDTWTPKGKLNQGYLVP